MAAVGGRVPCIGSSGKLALLGILLELKHEAEVPVGYRLGGPRDLVTGEWLNGVFPAPEGWLDPHNRVQIHAWDQAVE